MTRPRGRMMSPRKPIQERVPVVIEATNQRAREEICTCPRPVVSGRIYFGAHHCALCEHLIDTWGTWK